MTDIFFHLMSILLWKNVCKSEVRMMRSPSCKYLDIGSQRRGKWGRDPHWCLLFPPLKILSSSASLSSQTPSLSTLQYKLLSWWWLKISGLECRWCSQAETERRKQSSLEVKSDICQNIFLSEYRNILSEYFCLFQCPGVASTEIVFPEFFPPGTKSPDSCPPVAVWSEWWGLETECPGSSPPTTGQTSGSSPSQPAAPAAGGVRCTVIKGGGHN